MVPVRGAAAPESFLSCMHAARGWGPAGLAMAPLAASAGRAWRTAASAAAEASAWAAAGDAAAAVTLAARQEFCVKQQA